MRGFGIARFLGRFVIVGMLEFAALAGKTQDRQ
jgi:hypothetical protein